MTTPEPTQEQYHIQRLERELNHLKQVVSRLSLATVGWDGRGRAYLARNGIQIMTADDADAGSIAWLTQFDTDPFENPDPVPGGVIQGFYSTDNMDMSMTATLNIKEHYDGAPQGTYGLTQAKVFNATSSGGWVQAQTNNSGIAAVVRAYASANVAACQMLGTFHLSKILAPTALSANTNDYAPTGIHYSSVLELSATTPVNLTGIVPVQDDSSGRDPHVGRILVVINASANAITLVDASASSTAANRFAFTGNIVLGQDAAVTLYYSAAASRWFCIGQHV